MTGNLDTATRHGGDPPGAWRLPPEHGTASGIPRLGWSWPLRMINPVRHYAWGSRSALARLQGRHRALAPEAELWMGAHPSAPSTLVGVDGREINLLGALEADPWGVLGSRTGSVSVCGFRSCSR